MGEQPERVTVHDAPARSRFEIAADGALVGFADYRLRPGWVVITHSEIYDVYQGRGLASRLTRGVLDSVRERGLRVMPLCSYTAAFIQRNPEYSDLLDEPAPSGRPATPRGRSTHPPDPTPPPATSHRLWPVWRGRTG